MGKWGNEEMRDGRMGEWEMGEWEMGDGRQKRRPQEDQRPSISRD